MYNAFSSGSPDPLSKLSKFIGEKNIGSRNVHEFIPPSYQEIMSKIITRTALVHNPYGLGDRVVDSFMNELSKEPKMQPLLSIPGIRHTISVAYSKKRSDVIGTFWSNVMHCILSFCLQCIVFCIGEAKAHKQFTD